MSTCISGQLINGNAPAAADCLLGTIHRVQLLEKNVPVALWHNLLWQKLFFFVGSPLLLVVSLPLL
ncbi:hypothetical protein PMI08_04529 [Brevibacillus sp. CF112]|nr:hypothetical protein PMI08_04529 [Brevibacillus sp. CF112]